MMMKNKIIYWLIAVIILLGGIGGFFYFTQINEPTNDNPNQEIVVEDLGGGDRVVRNVEEGFAIRVPESFEASLNQYSGETEIIGVDSKQIQDSELTDGLKISVYKEKLVGDFLSFIISKYGEAPNYSFKLESVDVYSFSKKIMYGSAEDDPIIIEDSKVENFFFSKDQYIYKFTCTSVGKDYLSKNAQCIDILKNQSSF